jgi:hypothetical protein
MSVDIAEGETLDVPDEENAADISDEEMQAGLEEMMQEPVPWHGVLAPVEVESGDGRMFKAGALTHRDLPLPLKWQKVSADGHNNDFIVGNITSIEESDGLIRASGFFAQTPEATGAIELMATNMLRWVSVDVDMGISEFATRSGRVLVHGDPIPPDDDPVIQTVIGGRIAGATLLAIPAFQEATLDIGTWEDQATAQAECQDCQPADAEFRQVPADERKNLADKGNALPDGSFPIANVDDLKNAIQSIGRAKDPEAAKRHIIKRAKELGADDLIPETWAGSVEEFAPGTHDGPGWITDPKPTQRIRDYWVHGKGAAKIRWGQPGDFNRCRTQLAKYIQNPEWLAGTCANMHKEAILLWPGGEVPGKHSEEDVMTASFTPAFNLVEVEEAVTAGSFTPPRVWFENPELAGPTPLTVTEDGRVYGHAATFDVCHVGLTGKCVQAPRSATNYAYFHTGAVETDGGPVAVGHITMKTGHADLSLSANATAAHYDNTAMVAADVHAGEDQYGIWIAGAVRPGLSDEDVYALRASAVSGDWRRIGASMEMIAALAVNSPGFPIPRLGLAASASQDFALVAAGVIVDDAPSLLDQAIEVKAMAKELVKEFGLERARVERLSAAKDSLKEFNQSRREAILAKVNEE